MAEAIGFPLEVDDAGVVASGEVGGVHDHALVRPGAGGFVAHGVADAFRAAGGSVRQVVMTVLFPDPGTFLVILGFGRFFDDFAGGGNHVFVQFDVVQVGVAPVQVSLTIVIDEGRRINVVPDVVGVDQPFTQGILEGTVRTIGYQNTDTTPVNGAVEVKLAVALDALNSPGAIILSGPLEILQGSYGAVFCPVDHVGRGVQKPIQHLESLGVVLVVRGVQVNGVVVYHGGRIGRVLGLDDDLLFGWLCWLSGQCQRR